MIPTPSNTPPSQHRRPLEAPNMPTECPICLGDLFDEQGHTFPLLCNDGDNSDGNGDRYGNGHAYSHSNLSNYDSIAQMYCPHLIHSKCLQQTRYLLQATSSDGSGTTAGYRYGYGLGGQPRAGCPICNTPISTWFEYDKVSEFPIFWMGKIFNALETIGPNGGGGIRRPVHVDDIKLQIINTCSSLTEEQTLCILTSKPEKRRSTGFEKAILDGAYRTICQYHPAGGSDGDGSITNYKVKNLWDYDPIKNTLWLHKWDVMKVLPSTSLSRAAAAIAAARLKETMEEEEEKEIEIKNDQNNRLPNDDDNDDIMEEEDELFEDHDDEEFDEFEMQQPNYGLATSSQKISHFIIFWTIGMFLLFTKVLECYTVISSASSRAA